MNVVTKYKTRCDTNSDRSATISIVLWVLNYLFLFGTLYTIHFNDQSLIIASIISAIFVLISLVTIFYALSGLKSEKKFRIFAGIAACGVVNNIVIWGIAFSNSPWLFVS